MPRRKSTKSKKIQIGNKQLIYGKHVIDMPDSNEMYKNKDFKGLRRRLEEDGYLFIRNVIPKNVVLPARKLMLQQAAKENSIVVNDKNPLNKARIAKKGTKFVSGYCVDGVTGCETNQRDNIDIDAWEQTG
eukprot:316696_1